MFIPFPNERRQDSTAMEGGVPGNRLFTLEPRIS